MPGNRAPETPFEQSDDFRAYTQTLEETSRRADELIDATNTRALTTAEKQELPRVVTRLRQLLNEQLRRNGQIAQIDMADGSYDNATVDNKLRIQLKKLRNLDIDHNRMFGTRMVRKVTSWIGEDIPNWFNVKWKQLKDNSWQFLKVAGVAAGLAAGGYAGFGWLTGQGALGGLATMGRHLGIAGSAIGTGASAAAGAAQDGFGWARRRLFG